MDLRIGFDSPWIRGWIPNRVPSLSGKFDLPQRLFPVLSSRVRQGTMGVMLLVLAAILAWNARESVFSQALQYWERSRLPGERVWTYALTSRELVLLKDQNLLHRALRKLPITLDQTASVWISSGSTPESVWIIVFHSPEKTVPHQIYCRNCKSVPTGFESLGVGWSGFDQAMERLDRLGNPPKTRAPLKKVPKFRDPRAILY